MDNDDTDPMASVGPVRDGEHVKELARTTLTLLDILVALASLSHDEAFQGIVEDINDTLKPLLKWAARYGTWHM